MQSNDPVVSVVEDGVETLYPLSAYSKEYVEAIDDIEGDAVEELESANRAPHEVPSKMYREWHHGEVALTANKISPVRHIGIVEEFAVGEEPWGGYRSHGNPAYRDEEWIDRFGWATEIAKGGHTIWWRRRDTGDGILLDDYDLLVVFHDPEDDAAFMARFPEARL